MESEAKYALVGGAIIGLVALIVAWLLWLSHIGQSSQYHHYTIYFRHHSLSGLQPDSSVTMRGIKVGSVDNLLIASQDIELVKVVVRLEADTPVKVDTKAVIQRNLLTGLANIDLIGGSQNTPVLTVIAANENYPIIPEGQNELAAIQSTLPDALTNANEVLMRLTGVLSEENRQAVSVTLANIKHLSEQLAGSEGTFYGALNAINSLAADIRNLVQHVDRSASKLTASVTTTTSVASLELTALAKSLSQAAQALAATLDRFSDPQAILRGPNPDILGPGERR